MTFSPTRSGGYTDGTRLLGSEVTAMDSNIVLSLDTRGGTYVQSSPIVFSGDSWTIQDLIISDDTTLGSGSADVLTVNATSTFNSAVAVNANANVSGAVVATGLVSAGTTVTVGTDLTVHGNATIGDSSSNTAVFAAVGQFNADASFSGQITQTGASNHIETGGNVVAQGLLDVAGTGAIDGNTTLGGTLTVTGGATISSGSSVPRRVLQMVDAPTTVTWTTYNAIQVGGGAALTADRALTLTSVGMPDGAEYRVWAHPSSSSFGATIVHSSGTATVKYAAGNYYSVDVIVIGGVLHVSGGDFRP